MDRRVFVLSHSQARRNAALTCAQAPEGYVVSIAPPKRSSIQNARMWAMLGDIAAQVPWKVNGQEEFLDAEDWKNILTASLREEQRTAEGYRGGMVMLGRRTSRMTSRQMSQLIELMFALGAEHDVVWTDPAEAMA